VLYVAVNTVEVHLSHAYAKLGVRSHTQLAQHLAGPGVARSRISVISHRHLRSAPGSRVGSTQ
jgi:hypothetical protein